MKRTINGLLCFLSLALLFSACQKKGWDDYYGRPADLAPPIYQQLQAKGNFTNLLSLIDRSGYKEILGKAGSWTLFAANDEAFAKYFQEKGLAGIDAIDNETARKIATYSLVYNPYRKDQLSFYQTSAGPDSNSAYRRKTAYYDFVYTENNRKVVDNSRNGTQYVANENNNKHIPYFIDSYFTYNSIPFSDYTAFYPDKTLTGFMVADAKVVTADIPAENGVIHEIDKVILPIPNISQYIALKSEYSEFKKLLDLQVQYLPNADFTKRYRALTGSLDSVYLRTYNGALAFSPSNEGYRALTTTDGQASAWSIAVPTNDVLKAYTADLLQYYGTFQAAPPSVLLDFLNSHMWTTTVWPSLIDDNLNSQQEPATFLPGNVIDRTVLSNGNFYGINKVQEANVFRTIYRHAYLNPEYLLMTRAINQSDLRSAITSPNIKYTMFLISDTEMGNAGYNFNQTTNLWGYTKPGVGTDYTTVAIGRVNRFTQTSVLSTPFGEFDNLSGTGIAETFNGEYVKFVNNKVYASGNVVDNTFVTVTGTKLSFNGRAYTTTGSLKFAEDDITPGYSLEKLATSTDLTLRSHYSHFYNYLITSPLWSNADKVITGVEKGSFHTMFIPSNAAISDAVRAGKLPGNILTGVPNFAYATFTPAQKLAVEKFIQYSVISKATVAVDGKKPGSYPTLLKTAVGDSRILTVRYNGNVNPDPATMELLDDTATPVIAKPIVAYSNNLSNRALIHSIDKVLNF
ncbi:fasciclin domain-containing protein [Pedobacter sp. P351]|uniref:fasciclin domain-containing protein n=1 Tax=Pedobacter superstes TaxID=3133441 RepID=UPI00309BC386